MKITKEFLELGSFSQTLNQEQCNILNIEYPLKDDWQELVIDKELSLKDTNLFLFLRGKLSVKAQKQIMKNYQLVADFHKKDNNKLDTKYLRIYCDGACKDNPGKAGSGLAIYDGDKKQTLLYRDYNPKGTNNTAELNALYKSLTLASETEKAIIYSDSKYSIECITKWAYSWKKNNWTKKGGEIKNLEIIKLSHTIYEEIKDRVEIKYVKGHSGVEGNELADRMANKAISNQEKSYKSYKYTSINAVLEITGG